MYWWQQSLWEYSEWCDVYIKPWLCSTEASSSPAVGEKEEQTSKPKPIVRKSARLQGRQEPGGGETRGKTSKGQQARGDGQKSGLDSKDHAPSVLDKKEELEGKMAAEKGEHLIEGGYM